MVDVTLRLTGPQADALLMAAAPWAKVGELQQEAAEVTAWAVSKARERLEAIAGNGELITWHEDSPANRFWEEAAKEILAALDAEREAALEAAREALAAQDAAQAERDAEAASRGFVSVRVWLREPNAQQAYLVSEDLSAFYGAPGSWYDDQDGRWADASWVIGDPDTPTAEQARAHLGEFLAERPHVVARPEDLP